MSKMQSHDHYANQKGWQQPMCKTSPSSNKRVSVTPPKPSTKGSRQTESAVSPDTNTSNGGA